MSPADQRRWTAFQRRVGMLSPDVAALLMRAFTRLRLQLSEREFAQFIQSGSLERAVAIALSTADLDRVFGPVRARIRSNMQDAVRYFARDLPRGGKVNGELTIAFDVLNPNVIEAIRTLETKVMDTLKDEVRETVRAFVENGLRDGLGPRAIAREIRDVIGLAPNQVAAVNNFRRALSGEPGVKNPLAYELRDRRFDATVKKGALTEAQISKMTAAYSRRMLAFHADTVARTATLDALKLGQRLSWDQAIDNGIVNGDRLMKRWAGVLDDRERPEHVAMEGDTVPFDEPYRNGQMIPGESEWNCRCISVYFESRAA